MQHTRHTICPSTDTLASFGNHQGQSDSESSHEREQALLLWLV